MSLDDYVRPSHAALALEQLDEVEESIGENEAFQFALVVSQDDIDQLRSELQEIADQ
jgi:hypothetical protein